VAFIVGGVLIGLAIKFFGEHAELGVAQRQYAQTGRLNPRYVPRILLEAFIALWSGAAVGPEGPLVFLSGGVGSFIADRLKLDVPLLVYSAIAGAFGGFFGHQSLGQSVPLKYMFIKELDIFVKNRIVAINGEISNAFYNPVRIRIDRISVYQSLEFLNF
jgi:Voltage gated chloride channel